MADSVDCDRRDLRFVPHFDQADVKNYISNCGQRELQVQCQRGYQYFSEGYIHRVRSKLECLQPFQVVSLQPLPLSE